MISDNCSGLSCFYKTNNTGSWAEMVMSCRSQGAEMIAMDINLNITVIDGILNNTDLIWIRGTRLRWVWNYGRLLNMYKVFINALAHMS